MECKSMYMIEANVRAEWDTNHGRFILVVDDYRFEVEERDGTYRWRWAGGLYAGVYNVVKALIKFDDIERRCSFTDDDKIHFESFVDTMRQIIGDINSQIKYIVDEKLKQRCENAYKYSAQQSVVEIEPKESKIGYVYLFSHSSGLTKIGYSSNPRNREKTLQAEDPRVHMLAVRAGSQSLESRLHTIYSHKRFRGEWFDLTDNDISWLFMLVGFSVDIDTVCGSNPLSTTEKTARTRQLSE